MSFCRPKHWVLIGWRPSLLIRLEAIALGLEAIALRLEAIALGLEAIAIMMGSDQTPSGLGSQIGETRTSRAEKTWTFQSPTEASVWRC